MCSMRKSTKDTVRVQDWQADIPGQLSSDRKTYSFPEIRGQTRTGKATSWTLTISLFATQDDALTDEHARVISESIAKNENKTGGYVARILVHHMLGETRVAKEPTIVDSGKNIGRANETNIFCQALRDAYGLYNKHLRKQGADAHMPTPFPMLALCYKDVYDDEDDPSPIFIQRKYNGVRAVATIGADSEPILYSRKGLHYSGFANLKREIARICGAWNDGTIARASPGMPIHARGRLYLDGEIYRHGVPLQIISGIVRRATEGAHIVTDRESGEQIDTDTLTQGDMHYLVYDIFIIDSGATISNSLPFSDRLAIMGMIKRWYAPAPDVVINFAETFTYASGGGMRAIDAARELYTRFLAEGYEGAIIRINSQYEHSVNDRHSRWLLKMKPVHDAEFEIIDFTTGQKGKASGALLFVCQTRDGARFNVTPTGTIAARIALAREFARVEANGGTVFENTWKGKPLTVSFDELSPAGVPQRARTDGVVRTYE